MRVTIDVTGPEIVLLYLACGNEDAGKILRDAARAEREFNEARLPPKRRRREKA